MVEEELLAKGNTITNSRSKAVCEQVGLFDHFFNKVVLPHGGNGGGGG